VLLFPGLFPALMTLRGDAGARSVLETLDAEERLVVPFDRPPPLDIDTPDDYAALRDRDGGGGARR
jgi:CTP:molybdopterin cytidylyltransferase MocA